MLVILITFVVSLYNVIVVVWVVTITDRRPQVASKGEIYATILNLPREIRQKAENIFTLGKLTCHIKCHCLPRLLM